MFLTIPTIMTWTRIVAIPLIVGVFYIDLPEPSRNLIATVLFVLFAATDWLDGFLARKLNQISSFGAFLDPVADKFLVCASLLVLVHLQRADVFVALIIIGLCTCSASSTPPCTSSLFPFRATTARCSASLTHIPRAPGWSGFQRS